MNRLPLKVWLNKQGDISSNQLEEAKVFKPDIPCVRELDCFPPVLGTPLRSVWEVSLSSMWIHSSVFPIPRF